MQLVILLDMFFELLAKRRVSAPYFAQKYDLSERTVYRYVDRLSMAAPIYVKTGRNGGIFLPDSYKLPKGFFTKTDYEATLEALTLAYENTPDERFLNAKNKLLAQMRSDQKNAAEAFSFELPLSEALHREEKDRI